MKKNLLLFLLAIITLSSTLFTCNLDALTITNQTIYPIEICIQNDDPNSNTENPWLERSWINSQETFEYKSPEALSFVYINVSFDPRGMARSIYLDQDSQNNWILNGNYDAIILHNGNRYDSTVKRLLYDEWTVARVPNDNGPEETH